jgi:hypothetical protein
MEEILLYISNGDPVHQEHGTQIPHGASTL